MALIRTLFYEFSGQIEKVYDKNREPYIRDFWLPKKYQNRKDFERAFENHHLDQIRDYSDTPREYEMTEQFLNYIDYIDLCTEANTMEVVADCILSGIIPTNIRFHHKNTHDFIGNIHQNISRLSISEQKYFLCKNQYCVPYDTYILACWMSSIVEHYIQSVQKGVALLLETLPEAKVTNGQPMYDFLQSLL